MEQFNKIYYSNKRIKFTYLIGALFLLLIVLNIGWFCPFYDGIGIPCPGCGFTSASKALLSLNFSKAYYHHPLVFIFPILIPYVVYDRFIAKSSKINYQLLTYILIALFFIVYVLRFNGLIDNSATLTFNHDSLLINIISIFN